MVPGGPESRAQETPLRQILELAEVYPLDRLRQCLTLARQHNTYSPTFVRKLLESPAALVAPAALPTRPNRFSGVGIDLDELRQQAEAMDSKLDELLTQIERAMTGQEAGEEAPAPEPPAEAQLDLEDQRRIERLFGQAREDRSKAYELKRELDRLGVFREYEDRFLDLFKKPH